MKIWGNLDIVEKLVNKTLLTLCVGSIYSYFVSLNDFVYNEIFVITSFEGWLKSIKSIRPELIVSLNSQSFYYIIVSLMKRLSIQIAFNQNGLTNWKQCSNYIAKEMKNCQSFHFTTTILLYLYQALWDRINVFV